MTIFKREPFKSVAQISIMNNLIETRASPNLNYYGVKLEYLKKNSQFMIVS